MTLRAKRQPVRKKSPVRKSPVRRNPTTPADYRRAARDSAIFHGTPGEVIKTTPADQIKGTWLTVLGTLEEIRYRPDSHSKRGGAIWRHVAGDFGGLLRGSNRALVVEDPETKRIHIVAGRGRAPKFSPAKGILG